MHAHAECSSCFFRQAQELLELHGIPPESGGEVLRHVSGFLEQLDWDECPPRLGQQLHCFLRHLMGNADPYSAAKQRLNERAAQLLPLWRPRFQAAYSPLEAAIRLAIIGNLLDVGAKTRLDEDGILTAFEEALTQPLSGSIEDFRRVLSRAGSVLYLADNAGEVVFDRCLLEQLPKGRFALVVRGGPVLNDATLVDAQLAGLNNLCGVLSNGSDAPGTVLDDCSPEFVRRFRATEVIIAKGQGNFESLVGCGKQIFFLLKVKCPVLGRALGLPVGTLVLKHQPGQCVNR